MPLKNINLKLLCHLLVVFTKSNETALSVSVTQLWKPDICLCS